VRLVLRRFGGGSVKGRSCLVRSGARRQGTPGRSLRDLTSRCSGRGRLRPSLIEGFGEPAPQLNVLDVRSTGLGSRATCREGLRSTSGRLRQTRRVQRRLVRGAEVECRVSSAGAEIPEEVLAWRRGLRKPSRGGIFRPRARCCSAGAVARCHGRGQCGGGHAVRRGFRGRAVGGNFGVKTSRSSWGAGRAWRGCVEGVRCPFIIGHAGRDGWRVVSGRQGPSGSVWIKWAKAAGPRGPRPCRSDRAQRRGRLRHRQSRKRRPSGREHRIPARFRTSREISQGEYGRRRLRLLARTLPV
jgi:hypothetical protein